MLQVPTLAIRIDSWVEMPYNAIPHLTRVPVFSSFVALPLIIVLAGLINIASCFMSKQQAGGKPALPKQESEELEEFGKEDAGDQADSDGDYDGDQEDEAEQSEGDQINDENKNDDDFDEISLDDTPAKPTPIQEFTKPTNYQPQAQTIPNQSKTGAQPLPHALGQKPALSPNIQILQQSKVPDLSTPNQPSYAVPMVPKLASNPIQMANLQPERHPVSQTQDPVIIKNLPSNPGGTEFEQDQQFQQYLSTLTEYDRSRYFQLLNKNKQLRMELGGICNQVESLLNKAHKQPPSLKKNDNLSEDVASKMKILRQQQFHISNLKSKIASRRKELDETHQYNVVREKEDELKALRRQLEELENERMTLAQAKREHEESLSSLRQHEDNEERKKQLLEELKNVKSENKVLIDKKQELERELKKNHAKLFDGKLYVRELQKRIEQHKRRMPGDDLRGISEADVDKLKDKIQQLESERRMKMATHDRDIKEVEAMRKELEHEHERLQKVLTEKDREMRMNSLKMKELKRIQRARVSKPLASRPCLNRQCRFRRFAARTRDEQTTDPRGTRS